MSDTKQDADLVAEARESALREFQRQWPPDNTVEGTFKCAWDAALKFASESHRAENERLHGIEERAKAYLDFKHMPEVILIAVRRILHGDANAGGGE